MPGTLVAKLSPVVQANGTVVTPANSGFTSVTIPSGTSIVHRPTAKMSDTEGYEITQGGSANLPFGYLDFADQSVFAVRVPYSFPTSPVTTNFTLIRAYAGTVHTTIRWDLLQLSSNRMQFNAKSPDTLNVTSSSAGALVPGTEYVIELLYDTVGKTMVCNCYPLGSTTPRFTMSGALTAPDTVASIRFGIGTASSVASIRFSDGLAVGSGDFLARTDVVTNQPPVANAGPAQTVEAGQPFTLTDLSTDPDGTIASRTWKLSGATLGTGSSLAQTGPVTLAGGVSTYTLTVTDNGGLTDSSNVAITYLPATRRISTPAGTKPSIRRTTW